jgi:hypothetical protein
MFNVSLFSGDVPSTFKYDYITPLPKKADLDPADVKSYRPMSNLLAMSQLLERCVCKKMVGYLRANDLLPSVQSAYKAHRSTETAILKVLSVILMALDAGDLSMLTLLVCLPRLTASIRTRFYDDCAYPRASEVLSPNGSPHTSVVIVSVSVCQPPVLLASSAVEFGLPQGSVLAPILFLLYSADVHAAADQAS